MMHKHPNGQRTLLGMSEHSATLLSPGRMVWPSRPHLRLPEVRHPNSPGTRPSQGRVIRGDRLWPARRPSLVPLSRHDTKAGEHARPAAALKLRSQVRSQGRIVVVPTRGLPPAPWRSRPRRRRSRHPVQRSWLRPTKVPDRCPPPRVGSGRPPWRARLPRRAGGRSASSSEGRQQVGRVEVTAPQPECWKSNIEHPARARTLRNLGRHPR
jgi:hypothetical protein